MNHIKLLDTSEYQNWVRALDQMFPGEKIAQSHLRKWWREMCGVYSDCIVPRGTLPGAVERTNNKNIGPEQYARFAGRINELARQFELPEPFGSKPDPETNEVDEDETITDMREACLFHGNQRNLAQYCGVSPMTVSRWNTGKTRPNAESLGKIRDWLRLWKASITAGREDPPV